MGKPLQILMVEDSKDDTLLIMRELQHGGYAPIYEQVDTPAAMTAALKKQTWDIVIADYVMPHFSGSDALKLLQESGLDLPFIVVSGKIGEDMAVVTMKAGAHDYIMKDNLTRLAAAVERELHEAKVRWERKQAEDALSKAHAELEIRVKERTKELAKANEKLRLEIAERKQAEETSRYLAYHDMLTGLPNRVLLNDHLTLELSHAHRNQQKLAVMLLDLDRFKDVNDTLGHSVGDKLLQAVGNRLTSLLRKSDTAARVGGDEYVLLLPEIAGMGDVAKIAQKILEGIQKPFVIDGHELHVTTSIGIAIYPDDGEDSDILMKSADIAMYRAKDHGRNNYQSYSGKALPAMKKEVNEKESILIVDDDESTSRTLSLIFEMRGYETKAARTGREALEKAQGRFFNVALVGIELPDMEGVELLAPLNRMYPDMVMIMITAYASQKKVVRALNEGASAYITKPLHKDGVLAVIGEALKKQRLVTENRRLYQKTQQELAQRKRVEKCLKESEERCRTLFESAGEGILIVDLETRGFKYANPAISRMLGYSAEELKEMSVSDIHPKDSLEYVVSEQEAQARGKKALAQNIPCLRRDGTIIYVDINTVKTIIDGRECNIGFFSNVTERKLAEEQRKQSTEKLLKAMHETVQALAMTVETRDPYTAGHQRRVSELACAIAKELCLAEGQIEGIRMAAIVHDIGKAYVPAEILSKPGRLTETEFSMIKVHPKGGYDILKTIEFPWPIAQIVLQHHERMDGSGYPQGLAGENILLEARIIAVADVVEAIASHRPYRPALGTDEALEEISRNRGVLYDPEVVDACFKLFTGKGFKLDQDGQRERQVVGSR